MQPEGDRKKEEHTQSGSLIQYRCCCCFQRYCLLLLLLWLFLLLLLFFIVVVAVAVAAVAVVVILFLFSDKDRTVCWIRQKKNTQHRPVGDRTRVLRMLVARFMS